MLKKAGIVVAASAAALLAVSPLAFAGDKGGDWGGHGHGHEGTQVNHVDEGSNASGLIAIGEVNALNNVNVCPAIPVGVGVGDILGLLSPGTANVAPSVDDLTCVAGDTTEQENNG